jgi:hypothetical protein
MAIMLQGLVLSPKPKPVMMEVCCELLGVWDRVWRFNSDDSAEGYSGRTQ